MSSFSQNEDDKSLDDGYIDLDSNSETDPLEKIRIRIHEEQEISTSEPGSWFPEEFEDPTEIGLTDSFNTSYNEMQKLCDVIEYLIYLSSQNQSVIFDKLFENCVFLKRLLCTDEEIENLRNINLIIFETIKLLKEISHRGYGLTKIEVEKFQEITSFFQQELIFQTCKMISKSLNSIRKLKQEAEINPFYLLKLLENFNQFICMRDLPFFTDTSFKDMILEILLKLDSFLNHQEVLYFSDSYEYQQLENFYQYLQKL